MTSSGLEWDSLDCPLMGFPSGCRPPSPTDSLNPDLWHCQIHSLWSMSSATGCSPSSTTGGSRSCRLRQEEENEEGRRQWRRAWKEPEGSGRVKEVSQTYWTSGKSAPSSSLHPSFPWDSTPPPLLLLLLLSSLEWPASSPLLPPVPPFFSHENHRS